jgi:hypothetical protein
MGVKRVVGVVVKKMFWVRSNSKFVPRCDSTCFVAGEYGVRLGGSLAVSIWRRYECDGV